MRNDPRAASTCDEKKCQLPDCWCSKDGTRVPGNLSTTAIPQMITITFSDAINAENFDLFTSKPDYIFCIKYVLKLTNYL